MRLTDALRLRPGMSVAFTGAGGKSSALETLAAEARGRYPIVLTTSTRLGSNQRTVGDEHLVVTSPEAARRLPITAERPLLVTGPEDREAEKLLGLPDTLLAEVTRHAWQQGALVAIEADGARGRWIKAPAAHEPAVPSWIDVAAPIAGLQAIGHPLGEDIAHRPELVARLLDMAPGDIVTPIGLAHLLTSGNGGLKGIPPRAEVRYLLNGIDHLADSGAAEVLAEWILAASRARACLIGASDTGEPVRSLRTRVAGIVLAAGAGTRYGALKQLADWKGRPLVWHVIRAAKEAGLAPIAVVVGAQGGDVRAKIAAEDVIVVENTAWEEGQSTSVHAGLAAVERQVEAAVFLLADMPRVRPATIRRLTDDHRTSLPAIVAPVGGGRRGNPVLFDRRVFPGLYALSGDQGGRSLLDRWPWHAVEADPAEFADVDQPEDLGSL